MTKSTGRIQALLVLVAVLAPMTQLRFSIIGVAELLVVLLFFYQVSKGVQPGLLQQFPLTTFWLAFIFVNVCGAAANTMLLETATGTWSGLAFDLAAYIFMFMTCFALERLVSHEGLDTFRLMRNLFYAASLTFSALFVVSFFTPTIFGLQLLWYGRFVPLADNLHQVSMFLVPLPFLGLIVLRTERSVLLKLLTVVLIGMDVAMAFRTGSTKAEMAIPVGAAVVAWAYPVRMIGRTYTLLVNSILATVAVIVALRMNFIDMALDFFVANDNHGARAVLYRNGVEAGLDSFLVGRGPGQHVQFFADAYSDAHQTVLTVFLQAGILGLIALGALAIRFLRRAWTEPALLGALATVTVYSLGGDILRRLPIWIVLFVIAHYPAAARSRAPAARAVPRPIRPMRPAPGLRPGWAATGRPATAAPGGLSAPAGPVV